MSGAAGCRRGRRGFVAADSKRHAFAWFTGGPKWAPVLKNMFVDLGRRADLKTGSFTTETFRSPAS